MDIGTYLDLGAYKKFSMQGWVFIWTGLIIRDFKQSLRKYSRTGSLHLRLVCLSSRPDIIRKQFR